MDNTGQKIIDATMALIRDKGYVATTTKDIAKEAGVNECTIFRKFKNKKDIIINAMEQEKWRANISPEILKNISWDLQEDIEMFMKVYMDRITPDFVNLSIGLRAPQIYEDTSELIMKVPLVFVEALKNYFNEMEKGELIPHVDAESLVMMIFSATFGYTFLMASFGNKLSEIDRERYIKESAVLFCNGILNR